MFRLNVSAAVVLLATSIGCASPGSPTASPPVSPSSATAPPLLQPAAGASVVRFEGLVNQGRTVVADLASFDALPRQELTIIEPFLKKSMTFTGVGFDVLLDALDASGGKVLLHALDDYEMELTVAELRHPGVLLATRADGELIDVKSGGPVRLVFPPSSKTGGNKDVWVWSIDRITVR